MDNTIKFSVDLKNSGKRLDIFLSDNVSQFTRSFFKKLIENKQVKLNNKISSPSVKVKYKDQITASIVKDDLQDIIPKKIALNIVYEDRFILVVNKPKGMVVHPGAGNYKDTLVNALLYKYKKNLSDVNGLLRPGIVHRIDKDTSGILVVAKNNFIHTGLGKQFSDHSIKRKYVALIWGVLRPLSGKIETLITRSKRNRQLMTVDEFKGKKAITKYSIIKVYEKRNIPKISLIEFELETGRTHQIRVHMIYKGTSLLGDQKYRKKNMKFKKIDKTFEEILNSFKGQVLHAATLGFCHPRNLKKVEYKTKLPIKFKKLVDYLENLKN